MRFPARKAVVAGVLAGAVVLGGCAQSPSNVAVVGGSKITQEQYDVVRDVAPQLQLSADQGLSVMIHGQIADQVAAEQNLQITDGDRDALLNKAIPGALEGLPQAHDFLYQYADFQIVLQEIGQQQFAEEVRTADVVVNPRYGSWDSRQALEVIPGTGSISAQSNQQ